MFTSFVVKTEPKGEGRLAGYQWDRRDPAYVVCIIHGIGEHAGRYDRMASLMEEAGFAVISMDLPGHGASPGKRGHCAPRTAVRSHVDALISYGQEAYPGVPLILYGHSMGGNIVLDYRKRGSKNHVPAAYIVSAPWVELVRKIPKYQYALVKALSKFQPSLTISSGVSSSELGHRDSVGDYDKDPLVHKKISLLCALEGVEIGTALADGTLEDNGGAAGKPFLLMHGTEDRICSIKGSRKIAALEDCDYVEWPGLYHEIHNGGPDSDGSEVIWKAIQWIQALSV